MSIHEHLPPQARKKMTDMIISAINCTMKTVDISDLKAQLSAHIQFVKNGEEVRVCDRNKPVARIVPCGLEDRLEQGQRLVARGRLTPPLKKRPVSVSWPEPAGHISDEVMEQVWRKERENRYRGFQPSGMPVLWYLSAYGRASKLVPILLLSAL
jgi:prevent-host-death family protein